MKRVLVTLAAVGAAVLPALAAAEDASSSRPERLTDAQLDEVIAGDEGPLASMLAGGHEHGGGHHGHGPPAQAANPGSLTQEQVNFIIKNVRLTFNILNSNVNLAAVLQFALNGQPIQGGTATAVQTGG